MYLGVCSFFIIQTHSVLNCRDIFATNTDTALKYEISLVNTLFNV